MKKLETLLNDITFDVLPPNWATFDLRRFSRSKTLWDYQQTALENALKALWKYHNEPAPIMRKRTFFEWYENNDIELTDLSLGKKRDYAKLLAPYYLIVNNRITYDNFINRMGFWMATGSGKTLVIVKLIEILWGLMQRGEIPANDVLMLTHREDLLKQLREHVSDFNAAGNLPFIRLKDLKEFAEVKHSSPSLLGHQEITIFTYRSDNLSDEQKERIIDFHNYDNNGHWYILLDEAHKGDKEDSKRQHIYNILSRNGFLFNFSATFTDDRDKLTTAAEFNLASFIQAGFGKHIAILKQENRAFRRDEDFTDEEKQKIVLQSLLVLTYIYKARVNMQEAVSEALYHRPLLLALVNSVNTEDADLKLFFAQLERIAGGKLGRDAFQRAKTDLWSELKADPEWLYENACFIPDQGLFDSLTLKDVLKAVFNAEGHGAIEVLARPSNEKELAFKLQTTSTPFALIRIGNTAEWLKNVLAGYEIVKGFEDESFFEHLNADDSEITLLMGSRSFYEGWDSNRPNVITFINIGVGAEAKKFILQSVGRGVRIEPLKGKRKRLASLDNAGEVDHLTFNLVKPFLPAIETLFIFGTNRAALESVFNELDQEKEKEEGTELVLDLNPTVADRQPLLVPVYRNADHPLIEQHAPRKFELPQEEMDYLKGYLAYLGDERLLLAHHDLSPRQIGDLEKCLTNIGTYFNTSAGRRFGDVKILLPRLARYFDLLPSELKGCKTLENEINHYQHIRVYLKDIEELRKKIKAVQDFKDPETKKATLKEQFLIDQDIDSYTSEIEKLARTSAEETFIPPHGPILKIKNITANYYIPLLLSEDEKIDYIQHIIHVESEVSFIKQLEEYIKSDNNQFQAFDWWMFSRADETLDRITIPYYDPTQNRMRDFHPDFVFWLKRWNDYFILFVDPKGMRNADYQYKIDGYKEIFVDHETKQLRVIPYGDINVRVILTMHTIDANVAPQEYNEYWYDHPKTILQRLIAPKPSMGS
jgi:type III restriction enzyme